MIRVPAAILCVLSATSLFPPSPANAEPPSVYAAQSSCAVGGASRGEGKFTGETSSEPTGAKIEIASGDQSAVVSYNGSVRVCWADEPASVSALARGESVVVYGAMKRDGNILEVRAEKILIAGPPQSRMRTTEATATSAAPTDATGGAPTRTGLQSSGASKAATDDWSVQGNPQAGSKGQNPAAIACNALLFTVNSPHEATTGQAVGRTSVSGITCKRSVDATSMQFTQDALANRALSTLTLSWQGQLEVTLANAAVSSVQFAADTNGTQIVEVTFAYQKLEIAHLPSSTHMSW